MRSGPFAPVQVTGVPRFFDTLVEGIRFPSPLLSALWKPESLPERSSTPSSARALRARSRTFKHPQPNPTRSEMNRPPTRTSHVPETNRMRFDATHFPTKVFGSWVAAHPGAPNRIRRAPAAHRFSVPPQSGEPAGRPHRGGVPDSRNEPGRMDVTRLPLVLSPSSLMAHRTASRGRTSHHSGWLVPYSDCRHRSGRRPAFQRGRSGLDGPFPVFGQCVSPLKGLSHSRGAGSSVAAGRGVP
jgi:hypothetical protein